VKLKEINGKINTDCFALGGIVDESQIQACKKQVFMDLPLFDIL